MRRCPQCKYDGTAVVDTRPHSEHHYLKRRRKCQACGHKYTTVEVPYEMKPIVKRVRRKREPRTIEWHQKQIDMIRERFVRSALRKAQREYAGRRLADETV